MKKILIANRGEIAIRVIRACHDLGLQTVAVYSEADSEALHVLHADEAICIGRAASSSSYLHIPSIISAAEIADVEAIHPGYGFLAEDAHFAEICESCKIKFIGPTPENMRLMGDKMAAKETARKAGVPVVPGSLTVVALDIASVTTGGVAVNALSATHAARGGYVITAHAAGICVNVLGSAGTATTGSTTCVPSNTPYRIPPTATAVSVNSSASSVLIAGYGYE